MKKTVLIIMTVFLGLGIASAGPVDVNTAKSLGQKLNMFTLSPTMRVKPVSMCIMLETRVL